MGVLIGIISVAVKIARSLAVVELTIDALKLVGNGLMSLAKSLGLIENETTAEELGDRALQAEEAGIVPEEFNSYQAYVKAIENGEGYEYDPEKTKWTPERKVEKGIELSAGVTIEKYPDMPIERFYELVGRKEKENPGFFTDAKMKKLGELIQQDDEVIDDILTYMDGSSLNIRKNKKAEDSIVLMEKAENPLVSDYEALQTARNLRDRD